MPRAASTELIGELFDTAEAKRAVYGPLASSLGTDGRSIGNMDDERREPLRLVGETADTVTMLRADYEGLLSKLDDAEDRAAVLEHQLAKKTGATPEMLTLEEADRLIAVKPRSNSGATSEGIRRAPSRAWRTSA